MPFLALDLGTTTIKAALVDPVHGSVEHIRRVPFPDPLPGLALFCEIEPASILTAVRSLIADLLPLAPHCQGIVVCGQMGGLILVDDRGEPLSRYISWRDQRAAGPCFDSLLKRLTPADCRQLGNEVRPAAPLSFLHWLAANGGIPAGAIAASLGDFVIANLCRSFPATERTNAVGALNLDTLQWHRDLFQRLSLDAVGWPRLCAVGEVVGHFDSLPCYAPLGDHQCALAGVGLRERELSLNLSTGSQVSLLARRFEPGNYQTRPYFDGLYLNTITHIPAGRSLNVLLGLLTELAAAAGVDPGDPWPYIAREAARAGEYRSRGGPRVFPRSHGFARLHHRYPRKQLHGRAPVRRRVPQCRGELSRLRAAAFARRGLGFARVLRRPGPKTRPPRRAHPRAVPLSPSCLRVH